MTGDGSRPPGVDHEADLLRTYDEAINPSSETDIEQFRADALTERGIKVSRQEVFAVMDAMRSGGTGSQSELRAATSRQPFHRVVANVD